LSRGDEAFVQVSLAGLLAADVALVTFDGPGGISTLENSARLAMAGTDSVSHDFNGNMTALGILSYTWDTLDRLKTWNGGPFYTYSFSYDAQNRRTGIDYESTKFIDQGLNVVDMSYRKAGGYFRSNYLFSPAHRRAAGARGQHQTVCVT
jgi:hypothetical protein